MAPRDGDGRRYYKSYWHMLFWQSIGILGTLAWEPVIAYRKWRLKRELRL